MPSNWWPTWDELSGGFGGFTCFYLFVCCLPHLLASQCSVDSFCKKNVFILCKWVFCLHVCLCTTYVSGATNARRGCWMPWDWSYRQLRLWAIMWMLGIEPRSSGATVIDLIAQPFSLSVALNFWSSCLHFSTARIVGLHQHTQWICIFSYYWRFNPISHRCRQILLSLSYISSPVSVRLLVLLPLFWFS